ncbi:non-specific lipid-transfer protein-like protein At2g13820 [Carica papaya]|uniref:non-specific lipid-transfer protein-like protein At2g13820 n=1 Tax=Carica papaya TaxID=3649 RepID=UPI000B8C9029|nr:non-specific lipid-transfer protein-like protein At2g13820 [Carica papaya]
MIGILLSGISVNGQMITTSCTPSMISSVTPCLNFITGSSSNGSSSPSSSCCSSLSTLLTTGRDCTCLIITANVPLQLPINRTLALSLPQACNMGSLPLQCQASATPLPAPGTTIVLTFC